MNIKTKKERAIKYLFEGLTDEQSEAVAGEIVSAQQEGIDEGMKIHREIFNLIDELYQNNIWEK